MGCALVDPGGSTQTPESSCEASTCDWAVSGPCNLLSFETDSLCRSLAGRSILFVGDSITGTQFHSLAYLTIGASLVGSPWTPEHSWGTPIGICNNLSSIAFVRNDVLAPIAATEWKALTTSANAANLSYFSWDLPSGAEKLAVDIYHSFPWVDRLKDFHILVLNTGIHLRGRSDVAFQEGLAVAFSYLHNNYHGQVFYRLTTRGHPRCENATASPISGSYADYLAEHPDDHPEYEWDRVPAINSIERKLAAKFGVTLLDVVAMTEARPDSHVQGAKRDCLHYKLPSVPLYQEYSPVERLRTKNCDKSAITRTWPNDYADNLGSPAIHLATIPLLPAR
eukprot:jgi/Mesvir1/185/Mv13537-RA.1